MQNVLGVIMGEVPWHITEGRLQEAPYSSSVSKVLLCIAYDRWVDSIPAINGFQSWSGKSDHSKWNIWWLVICRTVPLANTALTSVAWTQSRNLILLEQKLNNSLNNLTPGEKDGK